MSQNQLIKSRKKAYESQSGFCIYCELPMWIENVEAFAKRFKITKKQALIFQCTAEHLKSKKDGGKDSEKNIVAACKFCNYKRHARKIPKDPLAFKSLVTKRVLKGAWTASMINKSTYTRIRT